MDNIVKLAEEKELNSQKVASLAALSPIEYDQRREQEAESLGVRVTTLDREVQRAQKAREEAPSGAVTFPTVRPSPEPVDGAFLLDEVHATIKKYIICEDETAIAATLWIAFTWFIDHVQVAPLAVITAPEKRCGKSQFLDLIRRLSRRPLVASNISPAAIFRVIEAHSPTLLIDEADSFLKDNEEARGIINSGHTRPSAYVIRVVGDDHEPQQFSTWGAKAISGIGKLSETLMDRAIVLELRRKLPTETVERLRHADPVDFERLTGMLARFAQDAGMAIAAARPVLPDALNDRAQDNWEPLLAIADHAGGAWPQRARETALKLSGTETEPISLSVELLGDIHEVFEMKGVDRISTSDLLNELAADDLKPWATYNKGKSMSPRQLAKKLSDYSIKSNSVRIGYGTPKGYMREWFEDSFRRYLPSCSPIGESATPQQKVESPISKPVPAVAEDLQRGGNENQSATHKILNDNKSHAVAVEQVGQAASMHRDGAMIEADPAVAAECAVVDLSQEVQW